MIKEEKEATKKYLPMLADKGAIEAGEETISSGQNFYAASSFN